VAEAFLKNGDFFRANSARQTRIIFTKFFVRSRLVVFLCGWKCVISAWEISGEMICVPPLVLNFFAIIIRLF
jgi:hypothetical protein